MHHLGSLRPPNLHPKPLDEWLPDVGRVDVDATRVLRARQVRYNGRLKSLEP